ncbi:hypothetical protein Vadar_027201 [Vaccinium darrowii]|uniref:Uncharacterized protein n=1 Tax=Vaccinium darrowii TaxID=229202 RepID=A0ACB7XLE3_9ERIC|nr:hypothetical protein Vadar_027201 [Vaccinium darrowii]
MVMSMVSKSLCFGITDMHLNAFHQGCLTSSSSGSRYMSRDDGMLLSLDAKRVLTMEYLPGININRTQALDQLSVDRERASLNCVCGGPRRLID